MKDDWDAPDPEPVKPKPAVVTKVTKNTKVTKMKKALEDMTEEEKKEAQLNADFEHAKELLGLEQSLDEISLESKDDYRNYIQRLMLKLNLFEVRSCCPKNISTSFFSKFWINSEKSSLFRFYGRSVESDDRQAHR